MIDLVPIKGSSNLAAASYDPATKVLSVKFHSGAVHDYHDVASHHYDAMLKAPSAGKYFHAHVRPHKNTKRDAK